MVFVCPSHLFSLLIVFCPLHIFIFGSEALHSVLEFMLDNLKHLQMTFCGSRWHAKGSEQKLAVSDRNSPFEERQRKETLSGWSLIPPTAKWLLIVYRHCWWCSPVPIKPSVEQSRGPALGLFIVTRVHFGRGSKSQHENNNNNISTQPRDLDLRQRQAQGELICC